MKKYNIYPYRTDLIINKKYKSITNDINIIDYIDVNNTYKTIIFNDLTNKNKLKKILVEQLIFFYKLINLTTIKHILVIGIGNDNYTSDSIGPNTLKHIKVNYSINDMDLKPNIKVSALEPGAFGETGILTEKIISSVIREIKPDIIILIDSYITDNINYLNKTIEINNKGLYPGCGIESINSKIDRESIGIPTIVIGVPTAVEVKFSNSNNNYKPYLLSTKDVDKYISSISRVIGMSINNFIHYLSQYQDNND